MAETESSTLSSPAVLFDRAALSELLEQEPDADRAFRRFPRSLDRNIKRANAYRLPDEIEDAELLLQATDREREALEEAEEEPARLLRVPSGQIYAVVPITLSVPEENAPPRLVAEVAPGLYRVRAFHWRYPDAQPGAESRLSPEDLAALRSSSGMGRLNLVAIAAATLMVLGLHTILISEWGGAERLTAEVILAYILVWPELFLGTRFLIRRFHPAVRSARLRLAAEKERISVEAERDWEAQPPVILLTREGDDPGDPGAEGWKQ